MADDPIDQGQPQPQQQPPPMAPAAAGLVPTASHAGLGRLLGRVRGTQIGRMVSRYQDPTAGTAVKRMHGDLGQLAREGESGRFWYEKSSKRILDYVRGNKDEAHKIAQLVAIYSPQTAVDVNTQNAIKAYNRAKAGHKLWNGDIVDRDKSFSTIKAASDYAKSLGKDVTRVPLDESGKRFLFARHKRGSYENIATADRDLKAHLLMNEGIPFEGRKTNNFYRNLMVHIDPSLDQGSTQDLWMARAFGFHDDAVSNAAKYDYMEKLTHKLANELGWKPHQVQAAIWTAMKTRQESVKTAVRNEALEKDLAHMVPDPKTGKPAWQIKEGNEDQFHNLLRERALGATLEPGHIQRSARDFSDFLDQNLAHVPWESVPSTKVRHMAGLSEMPPEVRADYHKRISEALQDEHGHDLVADYLNMLSPGAVEGPGYWQGQSNPSSHQLVASTRIKAAGQQPDIDESSRKLLDLYANARGMLLKQDAVGYYRPHHDPQVTRANGVEYKFNRKLTADEIKRAGAEIDKIPGTGLIPHGDNGLHVIHFHDPDKPENTPTDYRSHHKIVDRALQEAGLDDTLVAQRGLFASDGSLHGNDWEKSPNGEDYRQRIATSGRSDLLQYLSDVLSPKVEAVDQAFAKEHGLQRDARLEKAIRTAHQEVARSRHATGGVAQPSKGPGPPRSGLISHALNLARSAQW